MVKSNHAFSLIEVMVALFIMCVTLMALISVLTSGLKAQDKTDSSTVGQAVANKVLEQTLAELASSTDAAAFWEGEFPEQGEAYQAGDVMVGHVAYHYSIFATSVIINGQVMNSQRDQKDQNGLKQITVRVRWTNDNTAVKVGVGKLEVTATRLANETHDQ